MDSEMNHTASASALHSEAARRRLQQVEEMMLRLAAGREGSAADLLAAIVVEHLGTGGKRLRARLALAACEALGAGLGPAAVAWAAACELAHNATLVHDDLQDGDRMRRGHPTTWVRHGMAQAINAGDLLFMLPLLAIAEMPPLAPLAPLAPAPASAATTTEAAGTPAVVDVRGALSAVLAARMADVIRGQANEWAMTQAAITDRGVYERAIIGKTSALFELPVQGAALLARRDASAAQRLAAAFEPLGMLFQMQDDVLDLFGSKGREAVGSDLREGKVSALVVEHLRLHPGDRDWLVTLLHAEREATREADVVEAIERLRAGGALGAVLERIAGLAQTVRGDAILAREPRLQRLARELIALVLRPIAHL